MSVDPSKTEPAAPAGALRSGVPNLSPLASVVAQLVANGYSPLPIRPDGKMPGKYARREWFIMREWQRFCEAQATAFEQRQWATWPDSNVGLACGFGGLIAFDIDRDELVDEIKAVLPPGFVGKRGRKGETLFYRASAAIPSRGYKIDKLSVMDLISGGKQTVIPPSIHPDTHEPYVWTTERTLLDTPIGELPEVDESHVEAIVEVFKRYGYEPEPVRDEVERIPVPLLVNGPGIRSRDINATALANLASWVPGLGLRKLKRKGGGYRAVAEWTLSGTGKPFGRREPTLSIHSTGIVDFGDGDRGYTPIDLVIAARGLEFAEGRLWLAGCLGIDLASPAAAAGDGGPVCVAPAAHPRLQVDKARERVRGDVAEFFAEAQRCKNEKVLFEIGERPDPPERFNLLSAVETGVGKSMAAIAGCGRVVPTGLLASYAIPIIERGDEFVKDFDEVGLRARVYRGREQDDPISPGHKMCRNLAAVKAAEVADANVYESCCEKKGIHCPFFEQCGYLKQRRDLPDVWIIPHALLPLERPKFIPKPDALIIDESFHRMAYAAKPETMKVDEYKHGLPLPMAGSMRTPLVGFRQRVADAFARSPDGFLMREALDAAGVTLAATQTALAFEESLKEDPGLRPDLSESEFGRLSAKVAERNLKVKTRVALAEAIGELLASDRPGSGRITVAFDEKEQVRKFHVRRLTPVDKSWRVPTLMLDATPPSRAILEIALGGSIVERPPIKAEWSPYVYVRRYAGAHVSASGLGNVKGKLKRKTPDDEAEKEKQVLKDIHRLIKLRAAEFHGQTIGVVGPKESLDKLKKMGLPANVETKNFKTVEGYNGWKTAPYVLVFGFSRVPPRPLEADAGCLTGARPAQLPPREDGGPPYGYPQLPAGIVLKDGRMVPTERDEHPDPDVEALRERECEGGLAQAVGRVRPHDRTAETPCLVEIIGDMPLDIPVDEVLDWRAARPGVAADLADQGVLFLADVDVKDAFGISRGKARGCKEAHDGDFLLVVSIRVFSHRGLSYRRVRFKRRGRAYENSEAILLPNMPWGPSAIRRRLEKLLGPIDWVEIDPDPSVRFRALLTSPLANISWSLPIIRQPWLEDAKLGVFALSVLRVISELGSPTRSKLLLSKLRPSAEQLDAALKYLIESGMVVPTTVTGQGRPATRYEVALDEDDLGETTAA